MNAKLVGYNERSSAANSLRKTAHHSLKKSVECVDAGNVEVWLSWSLSESAGFVIIHAEDIHHFDFFCITHDKEDFDDIVSDFEAVDSQTAIHTILSAYLSQTDTDAHLLNGMVSS